MIRRSRQPNAGPELPDGPPPTIPEQRRISQSEDGPGPEVQRGDVRQVGMPGGPGSQRESG